MLKQQVLMQMVARARLRLQAGPIIWYRESMIIGVCLTPVFRILALRPTPVLIIGTE